MRTRLLSEQLIRQKFPQLRYVRIHTHGKQAATIYAWNEDLQLPDKELRSLRMFASDQLDSTLCYKVKSYNWVQTDGVPVADELPIALKQAAVSRSLNQYEIISSINSLFPFGRLSFQVYDSANGVIHFDYRSVISVSTEDKERLSNYLGELIPVGTRCAVTFY